ncbi:hypothetical protein D0469_15425 [Peribacillus saganii]|uniref:Regulatory protein YycH-like domain-containing protein n=1 Tax=Peribacillus saganii TaxID=2303992 RepID=A0A372LLN9_9BACI|nr:two-component system regulatory protein YycI [Peribacillus saganii]RFU67284.1 hypothetical protein D0469_15425 [Peribacillus saganii]
MEWSKTKSIFIIVFLVLNIFLLFQYMEKRNSNKYEYIPETSLEEDLTENDITYGKLPDNVKEEKYVTAKSKTFTKDDVQKLKGQGAAITGETLLVSILEKPFKIDEDFKSEQLDKYIKDTVLFGEDYRFWAFDEEQNTIIYYQEYQKKMFYNNANAELRLHVNSNREIESYEQTYLENIETFNDPVEILPPLQAIEILFTNDDLKAKSDITKVELGYYTYVQTASHVLAPTWRIVVDNKKNLFVNAFEGQIIEMSPEEKKLE